jgi:hypothetical protein
MRHDLAIFVFSVTARVVVARMRLCVLQMGLAVLGNTVGYVGAVRNVT